MAESTITLAAADGTRLVATHHQGNGRRFVVVGAATGVPRGFYRRFGAFLAERGVDCLAIDYRGIGDSLEGRLKDLRMDYRDWSRFDLAAGVQWALSRGPTFVVGHSLGGHAIGLLPEPNRLAGAFVCGAGAGWHGWMPRSEQWRVWLLWHAVGPIATRLSGYLPMRRFGMGENVPLDVYRQWKHWCRFRHYWFDDPAEPEIREQFARVRIPITSLAATDDRWAPPRSCDAFAEGYSNAQLTRINLSPKDLAVPSIGHMGYFRSSVGERLWPQILAWLDNTSPPVVPKLNG